MERYYLDALVQAKRMNRLLHEVLDLSQQLAEAVDREDQVTVQLLMAMRQEPIDKLVLTEQALRSLREGLPAGPSERLSALMGGAEAQNPEEKQLAEQFAANARELQKVRELDRVVNQKLTREKSIYRKSRAGHAGRTPRGG